MKISRQLKAWGKFTVGHGMCSGAFSFDESTNYEVAFSFIDSSGNLTSWDGESIQFSKPTEHDDE